MKDNNGYNYTTKPNPHVKGEWEVYLNGEIFCHLSDMDLDNFIASCKYEVKIEEVSYEKI